MENSLLSILIILFLIIYLYSSLILYTLAKKLNIQNPWFAFLPVANIYLVTELASVAPWTLILAFFPGINVIVSVWWFWKISQRRSRPGWWALLYLIPLIGFIFLSLLVWKDVKEDSNPVQEVKTEIPPQIKESGESGPIEY